MKLRLNRDLHDRARACADAVGDTLTTWICIASRCRRKGRLDDVAIPPEMLSATRADAVITISSIQEDPAWLRESIAIAVLHCEARYKPFHTDLIEGRDYIIGKEF